MESTTFKFAWADLDMFSALKNSYSGGPKIKLDEKDEIEDDEDSLITTT